MFEVARRAPHTPAAHAYSPAAADGLLHDVGHAAHHVSGIIAPGVGAIARTISVAGSLWRNPLRRASEGHIRLAIELRDEISRVADALAAEIRQPAPDWDAMSAHAQHVRHCLAVVDDELPTRGYGQQGEFWSCFGASARCAHRLISFAELAKHAADGSAEEVSLDEVRTRLEDATRMERQLARTDLRYRASLALDELGRRCMEVVFCSGREVVKVDGGYHLPGSPADGGASGGWGERNAVLARAIGLTRQTPDDRQAWHMLQRILGWQITSTTDGLTLLCAPSVAA